jgi:hypothetical protein
VSFIRLIRSDLELEIFGQRWKMPPEASHEYVRATIDVGAGKMSAVLHGQKILTQDYKLG